MEILFVCNGNVARSQEAELFFNALKTDSQSLAISAGVNAMPGKPIDPLVVEAMDELGYDVSNAQRKLIDENMVNSADLIVSFKPKDELPEYIQRHNNVRYWNVADPQHQPIEFHRRVRDNVMKSIEDLIKELGS